MKLKFFIKTFVYLLLALAFSLSRAGAYDDWFRAIQADDAGAAKSLLQRGMDPNSRDEQGQVGLFLALRAGAFHVAEALLQQPAVDVNAANSAGETPLMIAALRGLPDWEAKLLARGARLHQAGWSPVLYAAGSPEPKALALLLDRGAPIDARSPNGTTPLMMAARYGSEASVQLLLARGADARQRNDQNLSAADFARLGGRQKLAEQLEGLAR